MNKIEKKVAFYVNNSRCANYDCRNLENGNPGMGGTPYLIILIASELAKRDNGIEITLFVDQDGVFCEQLKVVKVDNCISSIKRADSENFDYIVVNSMYVDWNHYDFSSIKNKLRIIPWCHNFNKYSWNSLFYKEKRIARMVTVSREQLDLLRDHKVFEKGDYIYNVVPINDGLLQQSPIPAIKKRKPRVVFMGSLLWGKSFHVLASLWPQILMEIPDAELYVIGAGNLYDKSSQSGKYGFASKEYEQVFMKYLSTSSGEILPNVHFLGNLGLEKYDFLKLCKVAVPNPRGTGETFCISAVEMQLMGCNLTSMEAPGYFDTVYNGVLTKSKKQLLKSIVRLLRTDTAIKDYEETLSYIKKNFSIETVLLDWERLLLGDMQRHIHSIELTQNTHYKMKHVKESIRKSSIFEFYSKYFPSIDFYYDLYERISDKIERFKTL